MLGFDIDGRLIPGFVAIRVQLPGVVEVDLFDMLSVYRAAESLERFNAGIQRSNVSIDADLFEEACGRDAGEYPANKAQVLQVCEAELIVLLRRRRLAGPSIERTIYRPPDLIWDVLYFLDDLNPCLCR